MKEKVIAPLFQSGFPVGSIEISPNGAKIAWNDGETLPMALFNLLCDGVANGVNITPKWDPDYMKDNSVREADPVPVFNFLTPPPANVSRDLSSFIDKWAKELEEIYDERTAGDYTFSGFLSAFLRELKAPPQITINNSWKA